MRYLIFLLLVGSTSLHAGSIHKWVDENGNVHYGDAPPAETKSENVRVQSAPSNPGKALPRLTVSEPEPEGGITDEQAVKICETARSDLQIIADSPRIRLQQPNGTERYLNDQEIAERKAKSEADIERYCQ